MSLNIFGSAHAHEFCACCGATAAPPGAKNVSSTGILVCQDKEVFSDELPVQEVKTRNGTIYIQLDQREK